MIYHLFMVLHFNKMSIDGAKRQSKINVHAGFYKIRTFRTFVHLLFMASDNFKATSRLVYYEKIANILMVERKGGFIFCFNVFVFVIT